jgi:hypothetical protein
MVMLVVAGLIEGFVSPSAIGFTSRIGVLVVSLGLWVIYFLAAGRVAANTEPSNQPNRSPAQSVN